MSLADLGGISALAQTPSEIAARQALTTQQNIANAQTRQALNALQGYNYADPNSVNQTTNALAHAGMFDWANAANKLSFNRAVTEQLQPLTVKSIQQSADQQQGASGYDMQRHMNLLRDSQTAIGDILAQSTPEAQKAEIGRWRSYLSGEGVDPETMNEVFPADGNVTRETLLAHQGQIQAAMQDLQLQMRPGFAQSAAALRNFNPNVAMAEQSLGLNPQTGLDVAQNVTNPYFNTQVQVGFAPQIAAGTAAGNIAGQAAMIPSIQNIARAEAAGHTEGVPGQIPDPNTNALVSGFWSLQNGQRVFHEGQIQPAAGGSAAVGAATPPLVPARGLGTAEAAAATTGGDQAQRIFNADNATAAGMQATVTPLRQILDKLPTTNIGPGTEQTNELRSFIIAQLPWLTKIDPTYWNEAKIQTAQYNELKKYMTQVATTGLNGVFGQGSDQRFAAIVSGNPHITMDQLSAKQVTELAMAGVRAQAAAPLVFARQGLPVTDYPAWKAKFGSTVDPRGFMLDILSPTERKAMLAQIPRGSTEAANLKTAKNYAEQIGMYQDSDIPR